MKNLSCYFAFWAIGQLPLFAQTNFPFPSADAVWSVSSKTQWWFDTYADNHKYTVMGDSVLNGIAYKKYYHCPDSILNPSNLSFYALLRQDTQTQRSYVVYANDTSEYLLYDFSLQVGDTLSDPSYYLGWWWSDHSVTVTQVSFDDSGRKKIHLSTLETWIEGIGSSKGLFNRTHLELADEAELELLCFEQNGETIYQKYPNICHYTSITGIETPTNANFVVSPNPANQTLSINSYQYSQEATFELYNILGQVTIITPLLTKEEQIDINNLPAGTYFYQIVNAQKQSLQRGKLIILH